MTEEINIAVLGDLHGHIELALSILKIWEKEHGKSLDTIIQVGDLGYFPDLERIDSATKRFAEKDPEELGFQKFLEDNEVSRRFFYDEEGLKAPLVFIAGNHDDEERLRKLERLTPVDFFGRIIYLPSGEVLEINKDKLKLRAAGLSGIEAKNLSGLHFTKADLRKVKSLSNIDVLLTHEPQAGEEIDKDFGSIEVRDLIFLMRPDYHFCGHIHRSDEAIYGRTKSYILDQVGFRKSHKLNDRCVGILNVTESGSNFSFLEEPWLKEFKKQVPYRI